MKRANEVLARSLPFWSWNDKLEKEKLLEQLDWMKKSGFGVFFMHARAGLKTEYLGEEWFQLVNDCIQYATERGLEPWVYDENGWPSGFVGGKLLEDEENREWYLETSIGPKDDTALVSYNISGDILRRLSIGERCANALNVYKRISVSTVDILDDCVVDKFLSETHKRYQAETGENFKNLHGFFTDEPQYCRKGTPLPHKISEFFMREYGEDVLDGLGLLFAEKSGFRTFRYRYWKACQALMLNNFAKKIYDWCEENQQKLTGHYVEERDLFGQMLFNGGIMPFYEYEHIPGIDWLCRRFMSVVPVRQVGSVAAQLGKKEVLTESYAMTGWDVTPNELKAITEFQYLYGINRTCQHLLPYSEKEERKYDHPAHFTPLNPWVGQGINVFNRYFDWLGVIMQNSEEVVNVAVLHPIRSAYFNYKHNNEESTTELDSSLLSFCNILAEKQIAFHFIDETLLAKYGFVKGNKLGCGKCKYEYLILPKCYTMDKTTEKLFRKFVSGGGKVYIEGEKPAYLEGEPFAYDYLKSNVTLDEIRSIQPYALTYDGGCIHSVYRKDKDGDFIMLLNISDEETSVGKITTKTKKILSQYDFNTDMIYSFDGDFTLKPLQSMIILVGKKGCEMNDLHTVLIAGESEVIERDENFIPLDFAKYSFNGKTFSQKYPLPAIFKHLLEIRYEGSLWLSFPFSVRVVPRKIRLQSEYPSQTELFVNGTECGEDILKHIKIGENEIIIKLFFYENDNVYRVLFGKDVTESLKNCLSFDTYLGIPYLCGEFGVYAKDGFYDGEEKNTLLADSFFIGERQKQVGELTQSGEPFFAGRILLKKKFNLEQTNVRLKLNGRIHFARLTVNNVPIGECDFDGTKDISMFSKLGENEVVIELYTSARNQLGPHHDAVWEENLMLTSYAFDMFDGWKDFSCVDFREDYSFVKSGLLPKNERAVWKILYYGIYKSNQKY